jgi:FHS family L-fucose permease-like MFS transporter
MMRFKTLPIFLSFFVMGFGDVVGTLVGFARHQYALSAAMAGLLPFLGFIAYGILSVPTGVMADRLGRKFVLLTGLTLTLAGFLVPEISISRYVFLLVAILLVGSGITMMQVAGNPIMRDVSAENRYARNLTFAQFIKALGSLSGPLLTAWVVAQWTRLFPLYVAVIVTAIASLALLPVTEKKAESAGRATLSASFALLKDSYVLAMVFGLFLYVGAEVGMNSWIATYLSTQFGFDIRSWATVGIGVFFFALMVGRALASLVLNWLEAKKFFLMTSVIACIGILGLFLHINAAVAVGSILLIGVAFASVFPLIFSILIESLPHKSNELSGLMCMAIVGGSIMPLIMGVIADHSLMASFLVPLASLAFITGTAVVSLRRKVSTPTG